MGAYLLILAMFGGDGQLSVTTTQVATSAACTAAGNAWVAASVNGFYTCSATGSLSSSAPYKLIMTLGGVAIGSVPFSSASTCSNAGATWKAQMGTKQHSYLCVAE